MSAAAEYKDEGTKYFKAKQYAEAVRSYTSAIGVESDPVELAKLLGNRSTSYGLLNKHVEALSDAKRALQQDANYLKGYFRQATALMNLSRFAEAGAAAAEGLRHEPNNKQLQQLQQEALLTPKEADYRQYLVKTGAAEELVKVLVGLEEAAEGHLARGRGLL